MKTERATPLPSIGDIVLFRTDEFTTWPMIVTSVGAKSISGQSFQAGTEVHFVENIVQGEAPGQFRPK